MSQERIELPDWARKLIGKNVCPNCHIAFTEKDVTASGNRKKNGGIYYFFEVECPECLQPAMSVVTSRPCDTAQLGVYLMEIVHRHMNGTVMFTSSPQPTPSKRPDSRETPMTDDEIAMALSLIHHSKDHLEFLGKIGMSQVEINEYAKPRQPPKTKMKVKGKKLPPKLPPKRRPKS